MDGASGALGNRLGSPRQRGVTVNDISEQNDHDIFVRAHTSARAKTSPEKRWSPKWPKQCLIFDTETTLDPAQKLNFGAYRRCKLVGHRYLCIEEGIFHRDDPSKSELAFLQNYKSNPPTLPAIEYFPAETQLSLQTRSSFIRRVFWKSVRGGELIVGFNLPFDLSRLAIKSAEGRKHDWSLALSQLWKNPKTGRVVPNPKRPRIVVDAQNSKMAFIKLGSVLHKEEWPEGRFLDLRTLSWALRNVSYNLQGACKAFHVQGRSITNLQGESVRKRLSTVVVMSPRRTAC